SELHIPKSLAKLRKQRKYTVTINQNFAAVIDNCQNSNTRKSKGESWIANEIKDAYIELHRAGFAYSVECHTATNELVGGLYGIAINSMCAGESMFYKETDASKLCLWYLIEHLQARGIEWLDCQQLTPLIEQFGAREI